jgi:hypothetical protein
MKKLFTIIISIGILTAFLADTHGAVHIMGRCHWDDVTKKLNLCNLGSYDGCERSAMINNDVSSTTNYVANGFVSPYYCCPSGANDSGQWKVAASVSTRYVDSTTVTGGECYQSQMCTDCKCSCLGCSWPASCTMPTHCKAGYYKSGDTCIVCSTLGISGATSPDHNQGGSSSCYLPAGGTYSDASGTFEVSANCAYVP